MSTRNRPPRAALSALVLAILALPALFAPALAQSLDRPRFAEVLAAARAYADERTFIFYCVRQDAEKRSFVYYLVHSDIEDALKKIRGAGADLRQNALLVETVLANVRVAAPDAKDANLDAKCAATDVMEEITLLRGIGAPMVLRPAFRALN